MDRLWYDYKICLLWLSRLSERREIAHPVTTDAFAIDPNHSFPHTSHSDSNRAFSLWSCKICLQNEYGIMKEFNEYFIGLKTYFNLNSQYLVPRERCIMSLGIFPLYFLWSRLAENFIFLALETNLQIGINSIIQSYLFFFWITYSTDTSDSWYVSCLTVWHDTDIRDYILTRD